MNKDVGRALFGTNGVRGIYGKDLTPEIIIRLSSSLSSHFPEGPVVVGYDGRNSSPLISKVVCSAFNSEEGT